MTTRPNPKQLATGTPEDGYSIQYSAGDSIWISSVNSMFGRTGDITSDTNDYSASQINNDSTVTGDQVSDALEYLDGYVASVADDVTTISTMTVNGDLSGSLPNPTVTDLTITSEEQGSVLYFNGSNWVQLTPGEDGYALTTHGTGADPTWGTDLLCENITINRDGYFGGTAYFNQWPSLTPVDGYVTVDFSSYQQATVTLNADPIYITITPPSGPTACRLLVIQDVGGANTISWEVGSKPYAPDGTLDIASAANARTLIGIVYDGIDYYAVSSQPMTQVS